MINDGKPVVWLFLYIRYLESRSSVKRAARAPRGWRGGRGRLLGHLPSVLGFVSSDYR